MRTLHHHAQIVTDLSSLNSRITALSNSFKEIEPRNTADDALITLMLQQAAALVPAAEALLTIAYDPTPAEPDAP
jgi:hypothetical protein